MIKTSSSKLLLSYHQRCHEDFELARLTKALADAESELTVENLRDKAGQTTDAIRNYNKCYKDSRDKMPSIYSIGDFVLIRDSRSNPGANTKFRLRYKGPYLVKKNLLKQPVCDHGHTRFQRRVSTAEYCSFLR